MAVTTDDDPETMPEAELLALPEEASPASGLTTFFARRAEIIHQSDADELALELSGDSARDLMIFTAQDPRNKRRRAEEDRRRALLAEQEMLEYAHHVDRLLAQIDDYQHAIEKRRKEIEDNALSLHDGRRVYVDGNLYRDGQGRVIQGSDRDEAASLHRTQPGASTWQQKKDIDGQYDEAERLKQQVLKDRDEAGRDGQDIRAADDRLSGYEQDLHRQMAAKAQAGPVDYGSANYMDDPDDEYRISTVPAFTDAAANVAREATGRSSNTEGETTSLEMKRTLRPSAQGAPKPG